MARKNTAKTICECSRYSVLVGLRNDAKGDLTWDDELTTGCPKTLTGRTFAPGHDAKLKGFLIRVGTDGHEVTDDQGISCTAEAMAGRYGFAHMVREGIENAQLAREEKANKAKVRAHKADLRNERELEKMERKLAKADTTHDGNSARQERELAALVEAEEAKHAAELAAEALARQAQQDALDEEWAEAHTDEDKAKYAEPQIVTAKVGRWTYEGTVEGDTFHYVAKGEAKIATKFTLV